MVSQVRLLGLSLLLGLTGCACPGAPGSEPDAGAPLVLPCAEDRDCPDLNRFFCDRATATCAPACRVREDCGAAARGPYPVPGCDTALGCQCDEGRCVPSLCSADADCPGAACRNGACVAPPAEASRCVVHPDYALVPEGGRVEFAVRTVDALGGSSAPPDVRWTVLAGLTGTPSGPRAALTASAPTRRTVGVRADVAGATCSAEVEVLAAAPPGHVRVLATDGLTGRGVEGAVLQLADPDTGAQLGLSGPSDARGVLLLPLPSGRATANLSVFHPEYGYVTVARLPLAAGGADLAIGLRRNPLDRFGGYRGTFTQVPASPHLHLGFAGLAADGDPLELSAAQTVGPTTPTHIRIGTRFNRPNVPLPAGVFLALAADPPMKGTYSAQGPASSCDPLPQEPDPEAAARAGRCGSGVAWALAGDVPVNDLPLDLLATPGPLNLSALLSRSIPLVKRFNSSVRRELSYPLVPTPGAATGAPSFSDQAHLVVHDHPFGQLPLGFAFVARVPPLPRFRTRHAESVLLQGGAQGAGLGLGFVPLGMGAAVNENGNALTDLQGGLAAEGLVAVRMAPTHHGLEGAPYQLVVVASSERSRNDVAVGDSASVLLHRLRPDRLRFDPRGEAPWAVPGPFPVFPETVRYFYGPASRPGQPARTLLLGEAMVQGLAAESLVRVVFEDRADRRWSVLLSPDRLADGAVLPLPPPGFADRTFSGATDGRASSFSAQALRLNADPAAPTPANRLTLNLLLSAQGPSPRRWGALLTAYSLVGFPRPTVTWLTPAAATVVVPPGGELRVRVTGFQVGVEGGVRFTFSGPAGCGQTQLVTTDASQGRGEITTRVPAGCTGDQVTLDAELLEGDPPASPLQPAVRASITVSVR